MTKFYLQSDVGEDIEVPEGVTTIGRGPFLKVADKRVSRSHGQLKVEANKLLLLPTHANPCFYAAAPATGALKQLPRNQWQELADGDKFSLLPGCCVFAVVCHLEEEAEHGESDSSTDVDESMQQAAAQVKAAMSKKADEDGTSDQQDLATASPTPPSMAHSTRDEKPLINSNVSPSVPFGTDNALATDKVTDPVKSVNSKNVTSGQDMPPVSMGKMSTAKRQLPSWLLAASSKGDSKVASAKGGDAVNRKHGEEATATSKKGKAPAQHKEKLKDFSDSEEDTGAGASSSPKTAQRAGNSKRQQLADFSDSDSPPKKKQREPVSSSVSKQRGKRPTSALKDFSDSDDVRDEGKMPKGGTVVKRGTGLRDFSDSDLSGDENQPLKKQHVQAKVAGQGNSSTAGASSEKGNDDDDDPPPCQYGVKCYRKNPQHFKEYSHPPPLGTGKAAPAGSPADNNSGNGSLPECPYGKLCYRQNPAHRQQFAHNLAGPEQKTRRSTRKRTARKKGSVLDNESDDDGGPNTYDYDDSFLDDDDDSDSDSMDFAASDSDDDDWGPGSDADVDELLSEAKGFLKNKKMQKTT